MAGKDDYKGKRRGTAVPKGRFSRLMGLGGTVANVAGSMAVKGAKELASGNRPKAQDLLLTPSNALKLTKRLSKMRGAAMKIGQMISMDSGDLLPREFADVLARLRAEARHMPYSQLEAVLFEAWGEDWPERFDHFNHFPIAAASIGQVHRAILKEEAGDAVVAIKIQYPGVRDSIDSDIKNVASLVKMSGLLPKTLDINPLIEEARLQLHQEADYIREAELMVRYQELLSDDPTFWVPDYFPEHSTDKLLTMSYIPGTPIETLADHPSQTLRNDVTERMMGLLHRELYEFGLMQTDPNFANYQYDDEDDRIVLLDFGATREISPEITAGYRNILGRIVAGDIAGTFQALEDMGFMPPDIPADLKDTLLEIITLSIEPLATDRVFDFGDGSLVNTIRDKAMPLSKNKELWYAPPPDTVFIQRKIGGMYLLATRLRAKVNMHRILREWV